MENILLILKTFLTFLLSLIPTTYIVDSHMIANVTSPQQVIFKNSNEIVLVKDGEILNYNIKERKFKKIAEREPNDFVGLTSSDVIIICTIEHFIINSFDDFSTKFTIKNLNDNSEKEMKFFETIRPIYMDDEKIIAVTAVAFLKQYQYVIDLNDGSMKEIEFGKKKFPINIPKGINIKEIYFLNNDMYIIEDIFGNLYLRRKIRKNQNIKNWISGIIKYATISP